MLSLFGLLPLPTAISDNGACSHRWVFTRRLLLNDASWKSSETTTSAVFESAASFSTQQQRIGELFFSPPTTTTAAGVQQPTATSAAATVSTQSDVQQQCGKCVRNQRSLFLAAGKNPLPSSSSSS